jgi:hypothetical protein
LIFTVCGWPKEPYFVLVKGFTSAPAVKVNAGSVPGEFHPTEGRLILKLTGKSRVEIERNKGTGPKKFGS